MQMPQACVEGFMFGSDQIEGTDAGARQPPPAPEPHIASAGTQQQFTSKLAAVPEAQQLLNDVGSDAPLSPPFTGPHEDTAPKQGQPAASGPQDAPHGSDIVSQEPACASMQSMAPMVAEQAKRLNEVHTLADAEVMGDCALAQKVSCQALPALYCRGRHCCRLRACECPE